MPSRIRIHFRCLTLSSNGTSGGSESLTTVRSGWPQRSDLLGPRLQRSDLVGPEVPVPGTGTSGATLYILVSLVSNRALRIEHIF
jgi:hypothetical protein